MNLILFSSLYISRVFIGAGLTITMCLSLILSLLLNQFHVPHALHRLAMEFSSSTDTYHQSCFATKIVWSRCSISFECTNIKDWLVTLLLFNDGNIEDML